MIEDFSITGNKYVSIDFKYLLYGLNHRHSFHGGLCSALGSLLLMTESSMFL